MAEQASINSQIIEQLYCEALALADEVRAAFSMPVAANVQDADEDLARIARSCEGLRTTTRIMHAIAWLLNQRSYLMGELSEVHLRRHARLSGELKAPDPENLGWLEPETRSLIDNVLRLYAQLLRLDTEWRKSSPRAPRPMDTLQQRLLVNAR